LKAFRLHPLVHYSKEDVSKNGFVSVLKWKGGRYLLCRFHQKELMSFTGTDYRFHQKELMSFTGTDYLFVKLLLVLVSTVILSFEPRGNIDHFGGTCTHLMGLKGKRRDSG
jgi:hypothetical protein